jgi:hypothetical protein
MPESIITSTKETPKYTFGSTNKYHMVADIDTTCQRQE